MHFCRRKRLASYGFAVGKAARLQSVPPFLGMEHLAEEQDDNEQDDNDDNEFQPELNTPDEEDA